MSRTMGLGIVALGWAVAAPASAQSASDSSGTTRLAEAARAGESVHISGSTRLGAERYVVRPGDTLWDICSAQLANPWLWPEVWSLNQEITNPHWIYPGQVLRLRRGDGQDYVWGEPTTLRGGGAGGTIFFRNEGFIDEELGQAEDEEDEPQPPGSIVASWEDEMMLATNDLVYVRFREDFPVQQGQEYTIYRVRETVTDFEEDDSGDPIVLGKIVEILGTGRVETFDSDAHLARMTLTETINPIERGDAVGPVERNVIISEPRPAEVDLDGRIVALLRPRTLNGQAFVAFINRGYDAGVRDGNRFQIIRANDHYLESLREDIPADLPFEWIGECQVVEARKTASTCIISSSTREIFLGERVTLARGQ
ncbi:MAG: LysM peptidoglycan-binding domain-containing protein [Deltaproteobacteria bacterium]|nr:LysM peptidoglycan-binding domain-containing protein [Deltaproteobacteria bacterium]